MLLLSCSSICVCSGAFALAWDGDKAHSRGGTAHQESPGQLLTDPLFVSA